MQLIFSFDCFARYLEEVAQHRSRNKIVELLGHLFGEVGADVAKDMAYLLLGTLGPTYAPLRFNLANRNLFNFLQDFVVQTYGEERLVLVLKERFAEVGDLGQALFLLHQEAAGRALVENQEVLLVQIFALLKELALCSGSGSEEEKKKLFFALLRQVGPLGQKYLVKIIAGELRLGFSVSTLLEAFSYAEAADKSLKSLLEDNYYVCADVGLLIYKLKSQGRQALASPTPTLGVPICPAAAERVASLQELLQRQQDFVLQPKLDGLRVQIHKLSDGTVKIFSRNLLDVSLMFPEVTKAFATLALASFIVEGEALSFDGENGGNADFQATSQRRRKHGVSEAADKFPMRVFLFDLLYLDGVSLLNTPYFARREKLLRGFRGRNSCFEVLGEEEFRGGSATEGDESAAQEAGVIAHLQTYFLKCRKEGYEGVVAKKRHGLYESGKRGFNWIKIKHLEECKQRDTIDAVIIGAYLGKGRRADFGCGSFLAAIYDASRQEFQTIAKVGTGFSDQNLQELSQKLAPLQLKSKPANYNVAKSLWPSIWVAAEVVIEIEADAISVSKVHTAGRDKVAKDRGLALRFPTLKRMRPDKTYLQLTTGDELARLRVLEK